MSGCKHENADHLMPGDVLTPSNYAPIEEGEPVAFEQFRCLDCGAWLSLGPASDTPAALVELRAAEIAADHADLPWVDWNHGEAAGFDDRDTPMPYRVESWHAGWLAAAIVSHDHEQREGVER